MKLAALFAITALLYASVGFGGGSTYNALLALADVDYRLMPAVALICNVIVVSGGTLRFHRAGHIPWRPAWPLFALSVPMALLGGFLLVPQTVFIGLLGFSLLLAGFAMLLRERRATDLLAVRSDLPVTIPVIGGGLGLLAGSIGIGGGIFLAPLLHMLRWGPAKSIAGVASAFILVNSTAGLIGQLSRLYASDLFVQLLSFWPLFLAVLFGGQIGSLLATGPLLARTVRRLTIILVLYVAIRLIWRFTVMLST